MVEARRVGKVHFNLEQLFSVLSDYAMAISRNMANCPFPTDSYISLYNIRISAPTISSAFFH